MRAYRKPRLSGKRGRPPWVIPETVTLTQTVKHRDEHGRLLSVAIRAALGAGLEPVGTVHVERLNGALRDRLNALVTLQLFDHNFQRAHRALRLPFEDGVRRYRQRSPAMALGLSDHLWSFQEVLTSRIPITSS